MAGVKHRRTKRLYSSLSFLNSHNFVARPPGRIALFAFGNERFLAFLNCLLRWLDRRLGTRLSRYGWAFDFGGNIATTLKLMAMNSTIAVYATNGSRNPSLPMRELMEKCIALRALVLFALPPALLAAAQADISK